jgi:hypothetical protein
MVPEKYRLAAIGRFLIEQFELRRPGLKEWTPEVEASLRQQAEAELVQMEKQLKEMGIDDAQYWQRVRGALAEILLPRYARIATDEIALAKRDYGIWRGGDLVARGVLALGGFALGIFIVEVPYIPITVKWFPTLTALSAPFFPEAWMWWCQRRYRRKLERLVGDLAVASETLETYRPLSELTRALEMRSDLAEAPATPAEKSPHGDARDRERS